jgi:aldehyde dehydrogenase (NAD(P)+)
MAASNVEITFPNGLTYTQPIGLFIDNQYVAATGDKFTVFNPSYVPSLSIA